MPSIETVHLTKSFHRGTAALDAVSFRFEGAGAVGYLGPNGAGKSTTLKLLVGLLLPSRGRALLNGHEAIDDRREALASVGAVIETPEPYPTQSVREALVMVGRLRGLSEGSVAAEVERLRAELKLPHLERRCGGLSKGQRQRVVLAAALIGDPSVLLLDEPTSGLDPAERILVRGLLARLKRDHLVLLVSHQVADVAEVCDDVLILNHGRLIFQDTVAHARTLARGHQVDVEFAGPVAAAALTALRAGVDEVEAISDRRYRISFDGTDSARARVLAACENAGAIESFSPAAAALETVYLNVMRAAST
jgi:ABC-2 type transport system ATP-binding protein